MRINRAFLKSSLIYTVAGAMPMASALILLPFYVAYLPTSDFGALSIYFAFAYFIQLITTYSFDTSLYIHFHEFRNDRDRLAAFASSSFMLMLAIGVAVALAFTIFGDMLFENIFTDRSIAFRPYGMLAAFTGIFQALFKVHGNLLQSREKPEIFLWSNVVFFVLIAGFTLVGLKAHPDSLMGPVGGRFGAALLSGIWALARIFREFGVTFNYSLVRSTFSFNFYTFLYQFLQWVINYFDRIFMVFFLTLEEIGVYDFAMKCLLVIEFILNGLHNSFYPKVVSTIIAQGEKGSVPEINRYYHGFISVIMILICVCILTFPWIIDVFLRSFGERQGYADAIRYIPYISLIYIFRTIRLFYAAPYGILKHTKPLSGIYLAVSAIKILLMWLAIKHYGLAAVIGASILAAAVEIVLLRIMLRDKFTFRYNPFKIVVAPMSLFALILLVEPLLGGTFPHIVHLLYLFACLLLLAWAYRHELRMIDPFNILRR